MGIFGGSGVGKSTLIGMMARGTSADMTVLALVGERGREVGEFLEELGEAGRARSVVVVSTSDQSPSAANSRSAGRDDYCRIFLRTGKTGSAGCGFAHAIRDGATGDRTGGGRAADG